MNGNEQPPINARSVATWLGLGLLGIVLAVAIALVAHNLTDQPIGIAGEPVSAGRALDPPADRGSRSGTGGSKADQGQGGRNQERNDEARSEDGNQSVAPVDTGVSGASSGGGTSAGPAPSGDSGSGESEDSHDEGGGDHDGDDD